MLPRSVLYPQSGAPASGLPLAWPVDDSKHVTSDEAIDALVESGFKTHTAAENLHISRVKLLRTLTNDPGAYGRMLERARAVALVGAMEMMAGVQDAVIKGSTEMELPQQVALYTGLLKQLESFTDSKVSTTNVNVHEEVMRSVPPDVRAALAAMAKLAAGQNPVLGGGGGGGSMVIPHDDNPNYLPRPSEQGDDLD